MFTWEHTVVTDADPAAVWELYADVTRWTEWDRGLESITLDGPFATGGRGTLTVAGQDPLDYVLTEVVDGYSFSDVTEIPGMATLTFSHTISPRAQGCAVTHRIDITGPAAEQMGPMVTADTPDAMDRLVRLASAT